MLAARTLKERTVGGTEDRRLVAEIGVVQIDVRKFCHLYARTRARLVLLGGKHSSAAGDARRQADALQSGKYRGEIMSLVGLDQPSRAQPSNDAALHFDRKPQQRIRRRGIAPPTLLRGSGDSSSVHRGSVHATAMPVLMSAMVKMPLARARSPNPRTADQYIFLHVAPQKRWGEPPRRTRNGRSHQRHRVEDDPVIRALVICSPPVILTQ